MLEKFFTRGATFALALTLTCTIISCDDDDPKKQSDEAPPSVSFQNLDDQEEVSGTLSIKIDASDNDQIASIKFYLDDVLVKTLTESPFEFDFDTRTLSNGKHTLKVVAVDKAGNEKSHQIEVTVTNTGQQETLLTIQVAADYLGTGEKPSKAFVVLHNEDWKVITSASIANGATVTLTSDAFPGEKFTVTELLVYESEGGSEYLSATSYMNIPKGDWVLSSDDTDVTPKSVELSFNFFTEGFSYGVSSNAGLYSNSSSLFVDITNPWPTSLDLTVSPAKLFVRQYFNDGHNKFFMYENPNIRDGGEYLVDFRTLDNADASHELINELVDFPAEDGVVHLYGLPEAESITEAYYIGQFHSGDNKLPLQYPADAVTPFAGYFSSTQFITLHGDVAYNLGFGKFDVTPLAGGLTVEHAGGIDFVSTTGDFDFLTTHYSLGSHGDGTWTIIGPPMVNRKFKVFELPEVIETELAFVDFESYDFDKEFYLSDFAAIDNYAGFIEIVKNSGGSFPEAINLREEKNLMIDAGGDGFTNRKALSKAKSVRDVFRNRK